MGGGGTTRCPHKTMGTTQCSHALRGGESGLKYKGQMSRACGLCSWDIFTDRQLGYSFSWYREAATENCFAG